MPGEPNVVRELLLAELRCAYHRGKTWLTEIELIGIALKTEMLSPADALLAMEALGWVGCLDDPMLMSKLRAACCADA